MQQTPRADHPWRRYKNRKVTLQEITDSRLKVFIMELAENWDDYCFDEGGSKIKYMLDYQIANWLIDFLERNFTDYELSS